MSWRPDGEIAQTDMSAVPQEMHEDVADIPASASQEIELLQLFPEDPDAVFMQGMFSVVETNGNAPAVVPGQLAPTDGSDDDSDDDDDEPVAAALPQDDYYDYDDEPTDYQADTQDVALYDGADDWANAEPAFTEPEPVLAELPPPSQEEVAAALQRQADEQAFQAAATEARRKAEAERAKNLQIAALHEERTTRQSTLQRASLPEVNAVSAFNEGDLSLPFGKTLASMVTQRARAYFALDGQIGEIDSLDLFRDKERAEAAGKTLLVGLTEGRVEGASKELVEELCTLRAAVEDRPSGNGFLGRIRPAHIPTHTNDEAWKLIHDATEKVARQSSAKAHKEFFSNITVLKDGTVVHKNEEHPEKAPMEHDFDELVEMLKINHDDIYKKNGNNEFGFYVPLVPSGEADPIDLIKEHADGVITNVEGFGNGAFVALVSASEFDTISTSEKGGYLVFAYHPHVPGYERDSFGVDANGFNIRNARPLPTMAKTNVIEFSVNVWHLKSDGFSWVVKKIKEDPRQVFADPRPSLRDSHKLVVEDIARRREAVSGVQKAQTEITEVLEQIKDVFSSKSAAELQSDPESLRALLEKVAGHGNNLLSLVSGPKTEEAELPASEQPEQTS